MCSVLFAALVMNGGKSNWMIGLSLVVAYLCIAAAWFYQPPDVEQGPPGADLAFTNTGFGPTLGNALWAREPSKAPGRAAKALQGAGRALLPVRRWG